MKEFDDTPRTPTPDHVGGAAPAASDTRGGRSPRSEREEGVAEARGAEQNRLLAALPLDEYARQQPRLTPVRLHVRDVLVEADVPIRDVWFVREGVCSVLTTAMERHDLEVGTVGCEGSVGLPVLNGAVQTPHRVTIQIAGDAWRLPAGGAARSSTSARRCRSSCCAPRSTSPTTCRSWQRAASSTRSRSAPRAGR